MMSIKKQSKLAGFTLIEVMIVVAILGIITAIAYPSYVDNVRKGNRADAKAALNDAAQQMQRCYTLDNSFTDCDLTGTTEKSPEGFYNISVASSDDSSFTAKAEAIKSPQTGDDGCKELTLNHLGQKTPDPDSNDCW